MSQFKVITQHKTLETIKTLKKIFFLKVNYSLDLITIEGSMKEALEEMLQKRPNIKATLMGTRKGDPCG